MYTFVKKKELSTSKQKAIKILWIYSREIHKIFMPYSPDFHTYENTIKKSMKNSQVMAHETV